jgi:hypothetical protein
LLDGNLVVRCNIDNFSVLPLFTKVRLPSGCSFAALHNTSLGTCLIDCKRHFILFQVFRHATAGFSGALFGGASCRPRAVE